MSPIIYLCPGCRGHIAKPGRCPACERSYERSRGTTTQRGYGTRWQRLAAHAKQLQPWCSACRATTDLTVDHIDPATRGRYDLTLADVQVLCRSCNSSKGKGAEVSSRGNPPTIRRAFAKNTAGTAELSHREKSDSV